MIDNPLQSREKACLLIDRAYQIKLKAKYPSKWEERALEDEDAETEFLAYQATLKKPIELQINIALIYQFVAMQQSYWSPKPQHQWTFQLSLVDLRKEYLFPYLLDHIKLLTSTEKAFQDPLNPQNPLKYQIRTHDMCKNSKLKLIFKKELKMKDVVLTMDHDPNDVDSWENDVKIIKIKDGYMNMNYKHVIRRVPIKKLESIYNKAQNINLEDSFNSLNMFPDIMRANSSFKERKLSEILSPNRNQLGLFRQQSSSPSPMIHELPQLTSPLNMQSSFKSNGISEMRQIVVCTKCMRINKIKVYHPCNHKSICMPCWRNRPDDRCPICKKISWFKPYE